MLNYHSVQEGHVDRYATICMHGIKKKKGGKKGDKSHLSNIVVSHIHENAFNVARKYAVINVRCISPYLLREDKLDSYRNAQYTAPSI